ncbi:MAG: hypothetical protein V1745_00105 [Patescibacteria group bacterium]
MFDDVYGVIGHGPLIHRVEAGKPGVAVPCVLEQIVRPMDEHEILGRFRRLGLRHARYEELLGFAAQYPDIQRGVYIVGLGSTVANGKHVYVPCLWGNSKTRGLKLVQCDKISFDVEYWFLGVRMDA